MQLEGSEIQKRCDLKGGNVAGIRKRGRKATWPGRALNIVWPCGEPGRYLPDVLHEVPQPGLGVSQVGSAQNGWAVQEGQVSCVSCVLGDFLHGKQFMAGAEFLGS